MGALFGGSAKMPDPEPPATMPDANDPLAKRKRRQISGQIQTGSSQAADRLAPVPGTIGREFSRSTLGAR
jgi:hypothetical protein